ncbi:hypothetical protein PUR29_36345 [Methylobacterium ajmalii]|uniref:Uncharacterized protein n=1 Tax=Methylobacterium ajmalii TaxID=2738439 RepID=A0ABV0A500_9HYPH
MNRPRLVLTELREYRSERTGATYFAGYLGKARVVMLRDDRAEITGREVARWNILLEEPQPREEPQAPAGGGGERQARPAREERRAVPQASATTRSTGGRRRQLPEMTAEQRQEKTAAGKRAAESLRSCGIDPRSAIREDEIGL